MKLRVRPSRLVLVGSLILLATAPALLAQQSQGTVTATGGSAAPGSTFNIPVTLSLNTGVSVDTLSFGLGVTGNGAAPALGESALAFTSAVGTTGLYVYTVSGTEGTTAYAAITVAWLSNFSPALSGTVVLGTVAMTVPSGALNGDSYKLRITGAAAAYGEGTDSNRVITPGTDAQLTVSPISGSTLAAGSVSGAPGATVAIPVNLSLDSGVTADAASFAVQVSANGTAPVPAGALAFTKDSSLPAPLSTVQGSDKIAIAWFGPISPALTGSKQLGTVNFTIPSSAQNGQSYAVKVYNVSATYQLNTTVSITPGADGQVVVSSHPYLVGDVYPDGSDLNSDGTFNEAGEFGNDQITLPDLIYAFRVMMGFAQVPTCSDRFDAMDSYPLDTVSQRGGNGQLTLSDLIITFRRMMGFETSTAQRTSRGTVCPAATSNEPRLLAELGPRSVKAQKDEGADEAGALLEFGDPHGTGLGLVRIPVYLRVREDFHATGLAFGVSIGRGSAAPLTFAPAEGNVVWPPTLVDNQLAGKLGVAWLDALSLSAGQRVLLGYLEVPGAGDTGDLLLSVHGVSADSQQDGRAIRIGLRGWGESR